MFKIAEKDKERIVYQNNSQQIFFHRTILEDYGFYTCNASNTLGSTAFIFDVYVKHIMPSDEKVDKNVNSAK